ncbi:MAG: diguanylate cyclase [Deltaproteobacteria bacterium]|nr:diguanylate cyclase [Deltaproteobacteria bacterium]
MEQAYCNAIISAIGDGVTVQDSNYTIIYQNPVIQELFGNCVGEKCHEVYEQSASICDGCPVQLCFLDGKSHTTERHVVVNGTPRIVENSAAPVLDDNGSVIAAVEVVRDITESRQAAERTARFRDLYAAISLTNRAIIQCESRQGLFDNICRIAVEFGGFSLASISMLEADASLSTVAHFGIASRYLDSLVVYADAGHMGGRGPTGTAIREGRPYICNDFHNDPLTTLWRKAALENDIRSSAIFPLRHDGAIVGALKVYAARVDFFDDEIVELLLEMSANISFALDNITREDRRRAAEEALRSSEEQLKLVLEGSSDGYCDWRIAQRVVKLSPRYCQMLGYRSDELEQTPETVKMLVHPEDWPRVEAFLDQELISRDPAFEIEVRMLDSAGEWRWIRHRGKVVEWDKFGYAARVTGTGTDITDKIRYIEQLRFANTHDQLTGLFNRSFFDAETDRMRSSRQYPVSIVMADIDGLKLVNDSFGHAAGDRLIKCAANVLRESFRSEDMVARIGGDEFVVILPGAGEQVVKEAIRRVLACQEEINNTDAEHTVSISLGSATAENPDQLGEALRLADSRMYYYKKKRKDHH